MSDDYRQLREAAVCAETSSRGLIAVSGKDRADYLQGLLTNDIKALQAGSGCYAAWLSPQGRMTADMHVLESGDMMLLDVPAGLVASLLARFDQLIFSEDVALADLSAELTPIGVHGPAAAHLLERVLGLEPGLATWPVYRHVRAAHGDAPVVVVRMDQLGVPGFTVYVAAQAAAGLREALAGAGATTVEAQAVTAARIEAGYPVFGAELTEDIIPLEAGVEARAISFSKGCYVGQEVIIRVLHRGHGRVVRKLVGLTVAGDGPAAPGAVVRAAGRDIGFVTSAAVSPVRGAIALAYVHRDFLEPGTAVEVADDGVVRLATVVALPMLPVA